MSFNLQSAICGLQSAVCGLRSAVCGLQFAVCKCHTPIAEEPERLDRTSACKGAFL